MFLGILPEVGILLGGLLDRRTALPDRCEHLQAVQKTLQSNDEWIILSRREHPEDQEWSVVAAYGGSGDLEITPAHIIVLESIPGARGLTVSHGMDGVPGTRPIDPRSIGSSRFVHQLRGDLEYRIEAFQARSPRDVIRVVRMFLDERVRELEQPDILLTSGLSSAD